MASSKAKSNALPKKDSAKTPDKQEYDRDATKILRRRASALKQKENFKHLYREAFDYAIPQRNIYNNPKPGQKKTDLIFDSTGIASVNSFANRLQSDLTPPFQQFIKLAPGPLVPQASRNAIAKKLESVNELIFGVLRSSNFDTAVNEFYIELAPGTGIMLVMPGDGINSLIDFAAIPCAQAALEEGARGKVSAVFRDFKLPARSITDTWPEITTEDMPTDMKAAANDNSSNQEKEFEVCECMYWDSAAGCWWYEVIDMASKERMMKRKYKRCRFIVTRWVKVAGEVWGRGPLLQVLPDIKTLNKLVEFILKNLALAVAGVYTVTDDGVVNPDTISIVPGAFIPVGRNAGTNGPSIQALERPNPSQIGEIERDRLQMSIKTALLDNRLPPETAAVRSATEIMQRIKDLVKDIGAPFGRLMTEFITPLVQIILDILYEKGLIDEPLEINATGLQVQLTSPLAMVQNISEVETVVQWMSLLSAFGTEVAYLSAKIEDMGEWIGQKLGVPAALMRSPDERKDMQKMVGQIVASKNGGAAGILPAAQAAANGNTLPIPVAA